MHTVEDIDHRTRAYRRAKEAVRELVDALGGPQAITTAQHHACQRAAMLVAIAEDLAARRLMGVHADWDELYRAENTARRSVAAVLATKREVEQERPGLEIARARQAYFAEQKARLAAEREKTNDDRK